ncbi:pLS20_p028 family conjugation system transmembrane protein [Clostridium baratii]|uniref:pLS20_p028 family conjugation system transmembrane protein n=1 Tax=Clostridium baratii TaxID=1561 RepID=UPI0030D0E053
MDSLIYQLFELDIAQIASIFSAPFRLVGWGLINIFVTICNSVEEGVHKLYTINDFFDSQYITDFINRYKPIFWALLGLSLTIIFVKIIINRQENRGQIPINILFSLGVLILLPTVMLKVGSVGEKFYDDVSTYSITGEDDKDSDKKNETSANQIIKSNLWDLSYLDKLIKENPEIDLKKQTKKNNIKSDVSNIDINQKLDDDSLKSKDVFTKKVINTGGYNTIVDLDDGLFGIGKDFYYQFNLDFISTIITLGATAITLVCVCLKIAKILFDLAFNKVFAMFLALFDVADGRKLKEILKNIFAMFIVLMVTAVTLKLYIMFNAWLGTSLGNGLLKAIVLVGVSLGVINGPNIVERVIGEDAGVKNGMNTILATYGALRGARELAQGAKSIIGGVGSSIRGIASAGAFGAGFLSGNSKPKSLSEEMKEANSEKEKNSNSSASMSSNNANNDSSSDSNSSSNVSDKNIDSKNGSTPVSEEMNNSKENDKDNKNVDLDKKKQPTSLVDEMKKSQDKNIDNDIGKNTNTNTTPLREEMNSSTGDNQGESENNNSNPIGKSKDVTGSLEDRTIGQYMKDKVRSNRTYNQINRAYSLGENTRRNWNVKKLNDKEGDKK